MLNWFAATVAFTLRLAKGFGIRLYGSVTGYVGIFPSATSDNTTYTLPATAPSSNGQTLTSTTSGVTSWVETARLVWSELTAGNTFLSPNHGYVANNASLIQVTLPATAAFGSIIKMLGKGSGGWKIKQGVGQTIHFGTVSATQGVDGSLASASNFDCVELTCITPDTDWLVASSQGNLTIV